VYSHRGAQLAAISNILEWDLPSHVVYLWTLPMFHCNGWTYPWAIAARAGVNVCLRKVTPEGVFSAIRDYNVSHFCGAPIVHSMLVNAPEALKKDGMSKLNGRRVQAMVAGAAPSATLIESMESLGITLTHVYGLTEVYGPCTVCSPQEGWDTLPVAERAVFNARQGVRYHLQAGADVLNPETMQPVPRDGETIGEIVLRGNIGMKGYLRNAKATEAAFAGGWFHTGDIGQIIDGKFLKITDRKKEIFKNSGGKYISPMAIENKLKECRYIEQCMVVGEGQKFVSAIIIPSLSAFKEYCEQRQIEWKDQEQMLIHDDLKRLIADHVKKMNTTLAAFEQLKRYQLINANWGVETGEITPKLSLRRKVILSQNKEVLQKIFGSD
jgi:long-subunit acyl-CoA synthetase (AMP-forming)